MDKLQPGQGLRPSVEPVTTTWATLLAIRDGGNLIPGQFYRITDYVTTSMAVNTRSAGHPFDIIVRADSANVLNEQAWAVQHKGDTYFKDSRLEAWELKYNIDNIQWSQKVGTLVVDDNDGYTALSIGTVDIDGETYILWDASEFEEDYGFNRFVSLSKEVGADLLQFDPETGEIVEDGYTTTIAEVIGEYTEPGKGTITWMKDEWGNECAYDFKNIQFKRWKVTDAKEREGLNEKYMGVLNNTPQDLSIEDEEDFIWCYTFSSDNAGGEQADYSLGGHSVHNNVFLGTSNKALNNNVMFGENNYCNKIGHDCICNSWGNYCGYNSWGNSCSNNSWGNNCRNNSWGNNNQYNSWGNSCSNNSWGNYCQNNSWGNNNWNNSWGNNNWNNSWGNNCGGNSWGNNNQYNSWGNSCSNNSWGNDCYRNSWGNNNQYNSWGNGCNYNSWGNEVSNSTVFDGVQYTQITTEKVQYVQVLNGLAGTSSSMLTLAFAAQKTYTQVACKNTSGTLVIYVPGDLA